MITAQFLEIHVLHDDPTFNKSKPNYSKSEDPPAFLAARLPLKFYNLQYSYVPQILEFLVKSPCYFPFKGK